MKKFFIDLVLILSFPVIGGAQTTKVTATATITVTAPPPQISATPATANLVTGNTATLSVNVQQGGVAATGSVDLCGAAPGTTTLAFIQSFPLVNGVASCAYPVPANAPVGVYNLSAQYPSNGTCK